MRKIILLTIVGFWLLLIYSCNKDDGQPDCEIQKFGTLMVSNNSTNPYDIYIDDIFEVRLMGGIISSEIIVNEGNNRKLYAKQVSGYVLFPTERTSTLNIVRCSEYSWQIP